MSFITDIFRKIFVGEPKPAPAPEPVAPAPAPAPAPVVETKAPTEEQIKAAVERVVNKPAVKKPAAKKASGAPKAPKAPRKAK